MRHSLVRRLTRVVAVAAMGIALTASLACSDDDGLTLFAPERGLTGMWVRYQPPPRGLPVALPRPINDTLFIASDLTGHWSREIEQSAGIVPLRSTTLIHLEQKGMILLLYPLAPPCPACELSQDLRLDMIGSMPPYRVVRTDADHMEITPVARSEFGTPTYFYERRQFVGPMPD